jgi:hypothetical protein
MLLAACGGGASSGSVPQVEASRLPAMTSVTIRIDAPSAASSSGVKRRPAYLSPATQSITISINGGTPVAQNLTPAGGNCSTPSFGATPVCTLVASAPVGTDTFTFVTYDGANGTGNALSQNTIAQKIVAGQVNTVSVTLEGVPVGVVATPYPNQTNVTATATGYILLGTTAANFLIVATDADGNVIIGPGTPTLTVTSSSSSLKVAAVANNPNKFVLTPQTDGASVTLNISAAGGSGGTATGAIALTLKALPPTSLPQTLYSYVSGTNEIDIFAPGSVSTSAPIGKLTSTLQVAQPGGLAWAPGGALDVAGNTNVGVGALVVQYSASQLSAHSGTPTTILQSYQASFNTKLPFEVGGMAVDSQGDVFVTGELYADPPASAFSLFEYKAGFGPTTPPITISASTTGNTNPSYVRIDSNNILYVANAPQTDMNISGSVLEFSASNPSTAPIRTIGGVNSNAGFTTVGGMAVGPDGTLVVIDAITNAVYGFAPGTTNNPSPSFVFQSPSDLFAPPITLDANDNVYGLQFLAPGNQLDVYPAGSTGVPAALFTLQLTPANPLLTPADFIFAPPS